MQCCKQTGLSFQPLFLNQAWYVDILLPRSILPDQGIVSKIKAQTQFLFFVLKTAQSEDWTFAPIHLIIDPSQKSIRAQAYVTHSDNRRYTNQPPLYHPRTIYSHIELSLKKLEKLIFQLSISNFSLSLAPVIPIVLPGNSNPRNQLLHPLYNKRTLLISLSTIEIILYW